MRSSAGRLDALSYWVASDHFEELGRPPRMLHGGFGLITVGGIAKSRYHALHLLSRLGETRAPGRRRRATEPTGWCRPGRRATTTARSPSWSGTTPSTRTSDRRRGAGPHRPTPARRRSATATRDGHPARRRPRRRRHAGRAARCRRLADRRAVGAAAGGRPPRRRAGRARRATARLRARPPPAVGGAGPGRRPAGDPAGARGRRRGRPGHADLAGGPRRGRATSCTTATTPDALAPLDHGGGDLLVVPCLPYADTRREAGRLVRRRRRARRSTTARVRRGRRCTASRCRTTRPAPAPTVVAQRRRSPTVGAGCPGRGGPASAASTSATCCRDDLSGGRPIGAESVRGAAPRGRRARACGGCAPTAPSATTSTSTARTPTVAAARLRRARQGPRHRARHGAAAGAGARVHPAGAGRPALARDHRRRAGRTRPTTSTGGQAWSRRS